jgi:hypothetical protein
MNQELEAIETLQMKCISQYGLRLHQIISSLQTKDDWARFLLWLRTNARFAVSIRSIEEYEKITYFCQFVGQEIVPRVFKIVPVDFRDYVLECIKNENNLKNNVGILSPL